jgi:hypothetical protein
MNKLIALSLLLTLIACNDKDQRQAALPVLQNQEEDLLLSPKAKRGDFICDFRSEEVEGKILVSFKPHSEGLIETYIMEYSKEYREIKPMYDSAFNYNGKEDGIMSATISTKTETQEVFYPSVVLVLNEESGEGAIAEIDSSSIESKVYELRDCAKKD